MKRTLPRLLALALPIALAAPMLPAQEPGGEGEKPKRLENNDIAGMLQKRLGLQETPNVATSPHFRIITMFEKDEAQSLLELAEEIHQDFTELIEEPEGRRYWNLTGDFFILGNKEQYVQFIDRVMPIYTNSKQALDFFRKGGGANISMAPVSARYRENSPLRNAMSNVAARWLLRNYVGPRRDLPAFLVEGFAEYVEYKYEKSCRIFFVTPKQYGGDTKAAEKNSDSSTWPETIRTSVIEGTHYPFSKLKHVMTNELDFEHLMKAWSLLTFLVDEHEEKFVQWVKNMRKMHWEEAFYEAYGWTNDQLDKEWGIWVKANIE